MKFSHFLIASVAIATVPMTVAVSNGCIRFAAPTVEVAPVRVAAPKPAPIVESAPVRDVPKEEARKTVARPKSPVRCTREENVVFCATEDFRDRIRGQYL